MKVIFNIDISSLTNIYSFIHYLLVSKAFRFILTDRLFKNVTFHFQSYFVGRIKSEQPVCLIVSPLTSSSLVTFPSRGISPSSTQYPETALPINPDTGNDDKAYIYTQLSCILIRQRIGFTLRSIRDSLILHFLSAS